MTNADQPIEERLINIETQLEDLGDELDLLRTIQNANRRELRTVSQTSARLERAINQLADLSRLQALEAQRDRTVFQAEIRRIWEYLLQQGGNGNTPPSN
ncbi:MAG: hypothetical protein KME21_15135 [Desmonostoc vinosum HA7617-LM4]|jgi:signal transduction histidine kinase|nr:hypothetical protein [Desmonostoc vinosum HA7617-LM4]